MFPKEDHIMVLVEVTITLLEGMSYILSRSCLYWKANSE